MRGQTVEEEAESCQASHRYETNSKTLRPHYPGDLTIKSQSFAGQGRCKSMLSWCRRGGGATLMS